MAQAQVSIYPAFVAEVIDDYTVVINRGSDHDIKLDQRFMLYTLGDKDIRDPITGEPLGRLEIPKGTGKVVHVQERLAMIKSDRTKTTPVPSNIYNSYRPAGIYPPQEQKQTRTVSVPFTEPAIGDRAKPI